MRSPTSNNFFQNIPVKYYAYAIMSIIALISISSILKRSIFIVYPGERGLIINLGKLQNKPLDEGFHFIIPYVSSGKKINVRIQKTVVKSTARTKDLQRLETEMALNWKIDPLKVQDIYQTIGSEQDIDIKIITPAFEEIVKSSIPSRSLDNALAQREQLREEVTAKIQKRLAPFGVLVADVSIINLIASEEFTKATEARQVAEQEVITAKKQAEALIIKAKGTAESQKILQQTLTSQLLQKQLIDKWDGKLPTVTSGNNIPLININPTTGQNN